MGTDEQDAAKLERIKRRRARVKAEALGREPYARRLELLERLRIRIADRLRKRRQRAKPESSK